MRCAGIDKRGCSRFVRTDRQQCDRCHEKDNPIMYSWNGLEPDDDDLPLRCLGTTTRGCGRFVRYGHYHCNDCAKILREDALGEASEDAARLAAPAPASADDLPL